MSEKTYCDRCKKECKTGLNIFYIPSFIAFATHYDLCRKCNRELKKFMEMNSCDSSPRKM